MQKGTDYNSVADRNVVFPGVAPQILRFLVLYVDHEPKTTLNFGKGGLMHFSYDDGHFSSNTFYLPPRIPQLNAGLCEHQAQNV